jgi:hypothetical protein
MPIKDIFLERHVLPRTLMEVLSAGLGRGWLEWEHETIRAEIVKTLGVEPIEAVFEKIMALQTLLKTDLFWDDALIFENTVLAFNGLPFDFDLIKTCQPREIAYGVVAAIDLRDKSDFVPDVAEYVRACHREYGVLVFHPVLASMQPQYDGFRGEIAEHVQKEIASGRPPLENLNHANAIEVQYLKAWDALMYVQELVQEGKELAERAKQSS